MGAAGSSPLDCSIDDSPIQTTEDWTLHHAQNKDQGPLSVFIDNQFQPESKLHALARSLKQYRHPSILKYVYWSAGAGRAWLFTEKVCPLGLVRGQQTSHTVGLGLLEVCQALQFLHDKGNVTHGNVCQSCVFVTPEGRWKVGGLDKIQKIPQTQNPAQNKQTETSRDILALGVVIMEILVGFEDPVSLSFLEFSNSNLLLPDLTRRPSISQVLEHSYFQQPYMQIYTFLKNITLKTEDQKKLFFTSLADELKDIPEGVLGQRFTELLLSRYVLMDATARKRLIPKVLQSKMKNSAALFSEENFKEYVVPQIRKMFLVYDTGVRLILLEHFCKFSSSIDVGTLEDDILPALLLGLRDSNHAIVSQTLRALADLVPILGPEIVIGKNRSKVFSDGSPNRKTENVIPEYSFKSLTDIVRINPEVRQDIISVEEECKEIQANSMSEEENWDTWGDEGEVDDFKPDDFEKSELMIESNSEQIKEGQDSYSYGNGMSNQSPLKKDGLEPAITRQTNIDNLVRNVQELDILKLDIKQHASKPKVKEEVDFFAEMTPNITKRKSSMEQFQSELESTKQDQMKKFEAVEVDEEDGWGDEEELEWE